jgi:hypothetical protein
MSTNSKLMLAAFASGALLVLGQPGAFAADSSKPGPAKVVKIEGSDLSQIELTEAAMKRLGMETAPVREMLIQPRPTAAAMGAVPTAIKPTVLASSALLAAGEGDEETDTVAETGAAGATTAPVQAAPEVRKVIPYSAVIYDLTGKAWVYTSPKPLTYVRHPITIDYSRGDTTVLTDGPPAGVEVVTIGAAELYGAETGVK